MSKIIQFWRGRLAGRVVVFALAGAILPGAALAPGPALAGSGQLAGVEMLTRAEWKASPALPGMIRQKPAFLTIHHTAVRQKPKLSLARKLKSLQRFSQRRERLASGKMKKAWADTPYHYYVGVRGGVGEGRDPRFAGDTNTNYNPLNHIQIVVEGNFQKDRPNPRQLKALENLLVALARKWRIPASRIFGHKHHASTLCPGTHLMSQIPALRRRVAARLGKR